MGTNLSELEIVVVDCQTTGATPAHGHLIELAWGSVTASDPDAGEVRCFTLRLPEGESVPGRIRSITGISDDDLASGIEPEEAWWLFRAALRKQSGEWRTPVAHYCRFEELWLRDLARRTSVDEPPPSGFICTREIARRLYPGLPRKGLHALSGYLGRTMPELKRAGDHVRATAYAWKRMVTQLESHGITDLEQLREWLGKPPPKSVGPRTYPLPRETRLSLPDLPGVYRFLGADGTILYVGKATSLRKRVSSYFTKRKADEKTLELVTQVHDVRITRCGSPLEAAILECRLIRRHHPPYNRAMRAGDEGLWFCSADRRTWGNTLSTELSTGPFHTREAHDRLMYLLDLTRGKTVPDSGEVESLFYLDSTGSESGALEEGISMLSEEFTGLGLNGFHQHVLLLGRDLWHEMLIRREALAEEECGDEEENGEEETERLLTAEDIFSRLRWTVAEAALAERRSRWFRLLAWSTVSWTPPSAPGGGKRFLVLRNGGVLSSGEGKPSSSVPPPVRSMSPVLHRTGFEMLRVLTGELRRVSASDGTGVEIRLPTGKTLAGDSLVRLLRMV